MSPFRREVTVSSGFCVEYQRIVQNRGDGESLTKATRGVKDRTLANEKNFICNCPGGNPKAAICQPTQ